VKDDSGTPDRREKGDSGIAWLTDGSGGSWLAGGSGGSGQTGGSGGSSNPIVTLRGTLFGSHPNSRPDHTKTKTKTKELRSERDKSPLLFPHLVALHPEFKMDYIYIF
jgi:hypothetical protein